VAGNLPREGDPSIAPQAYRWRGTIVSELSFVWQAPAEASFLRYFVTENGS
jgi:hypothetical protein